MNSPNPKSSKHHNNQENQRKTPSKKKLWKHIFCKTKTINPYFPQEKEEQKKKREERKIIKKKNPQTTEMPVHKFFKTQILKSMLELEKQDQREL